jgi:transcriptional regulator of acetoin/glycerol metabolism
MVRAPDADHEPDIVLVILQLVRLVNPSVTSEEAQRVEQQVRDEYGGLRTRIAKRKKHMSQEQRARLFREALTDGRPTDELAAAAGIHRSTFYRNMKRGGE